MEKLVSLIDTKRMLLDNNLELKVLSYIINKRTIPEKIREVDFASKQNATIFNIILDLDKKHISYEQEIIISYFEETEQARVKLYIENLPEVPDDVNGIITQLNYLTEKRHLKNTLAKGLSKIDDISIDTQDILNEIDEGIVNLPRVEAIEIIAPSDYMNWRKTTHKTRRETGRAFLGTGLDDIDIELGDGFTTGILSIITGITSHGKSILAGMFAQYIASRPDRNEEVLFYSPETGMDKLADRFDSQLTEIPIKQIRNIMTWAKDDERFHSLKVAAEVQSKWRIHRVDKRGLTSVEFIRICKDYKKKYPNLAVVFIDTVQDLSDNIDWEGMGTQNNSLEKMLHKFEVASKELDLHFCFLCQKTKEGQKKKEEKRYIPRLKDLRGSAAYEQKITWALEVYRPYIDEREEGTDNEIQIWKLKDRDGNRMVCYKYQFIGSEFRIGEFIEKEY